MAVPVVVPAAVLGIVVSTVVPVVALVVPGRLLAVERVVVADVPVGAVVVVVPVAPTVVVVGVPGPGTGELGLIGGKVVPGGGVTPGTGFVPSIAPLAPGTVEPPVAALAAGAEPVV